MRKELQRSKKRTLTQDKNRKEKGRSIVFEEKANT